ncbi:response regulator [Caenimonas aquaedulcis]|uniref:Response regulator transcription factor n=1 Tax=Caenimonas aquaedulcis TaxID=2793270 RepID=A0A931MJS4_9BURK|nr:response regulator transcription factor [Caenimonas aquaedulcis]
MSGASAVSIVIVDDHAIMREGLARILEQHADFQVVGSCGDGRESLALIAALQPRVAVLDISMPHLNGIEVARQVKERSPQTAVVILSMHASAEHVFQALEAGARGYLQKESAAREIVEALRAVAAGRRYLSPRIAQVVAEHDGERGAPLPSLQALSRREREILQLVAEGHSSAEIGAMLFLSPKTIDSYRSRLMAKLKLADVPSLVRFAIRQGVISLD